METYSYHNIAENLSPLLAAISNPARLQILLHLAKYNDCHAGNISNSLPLVKSTVSEHLSKLKKAGLITCNPEGNCINYRISDTGIDLLKNKFSEFVSFIEQWKERRTGCFREYPLGSVKLNG